MQYFERSVFEYHPENNAPYNVLLSQLGTFEYRKRYGTHGAPNQQPNTSKGSVLVPETGKRLGGVFLKYWQEHGGLPQQGFPISEEFHEVSALNGQMYLVQYFERAVFEYHPENHPPFDVLLSHLGRFRYNQQYNSQASAKLVISSTGKAVGSGQYVFATDSGLPHNPLWGYNVGSDARILVTEQPGYKNEMASDGKDVVWFTPLNSITRTGTLDGLHIGSGVRFSIPISRTGGLGGLAVENGVLYYYHAVTDGRTLFARDIATDREHVVVERPFDTLPDGNKVAGDIFERVVVRDGVLVWSEIHYEPGVPQTNAEWSLHMMKVDGTVGDTVLATGPAALRGFDVSGDNVVWSFGSSNLADPPTESNRVTLYNIRTGVKMVLSPTGVRGSDPIIKGNLVVWAEGTDYFPFQGRNGAVNAMMKVYDIDTGGMYTLFRQSSFVAPVAIVGDNSLAYTLYDQMKGTTGVYILELPASK